MFNACCSRETPLRETRRMAYAAAYGPSTRQTRPTVQEAFLRVIIKAGLYNKDRI